MESFYRKVYLRSWRIVKNNWYLLFFGLFVSTLGLTGDFKALSNLEANDIISTTLVDWINIFPYQQRLNYYTDSFCEQLAEQGDHDPALFLSAAWNRAGKRDTVAAACTADLLTYLPCDLNTKVDIATMAHSLECRQPFLDHHLVEFAASIPTSMKVRRGTGKQILQDTFGDLLPENIWNRPKMGFGVPLDRWFRNELRDQTRDTLLASNAQCHDWVHRKQIEIMLSEHQSRKTDHSQRLWSLLMLENWFQHWIA